MIAYNPSVNDRSGELIAGGISQAASGISGAIDKLSAYKLQSDQADSTAALAHKMGLIDADALKTIQNTPWMQKASIAPNLIQLVGQQTAANHWNMMAGLSQAKLDQAGEKTQPVSLY
jgi:hypothetical protein